jgi:hypothetical protein
MKNCQLIGGAKLGGSILSPFFNYFQKYCVLGLKKNKIKGILTSFCADLL